MIISRNPELPDYGNYIMMYNSGDLRKGIEISYIALVNLFFYFQDGFYIILIVYAVIGFVFKYIFAYNYIWKIRGKWIFLLFIFSYIAGFMLMWDFIQMRASAGVSFFMLGVLIKGNVKKILMFILAVAFHYSMIAPVAIFAIYFFVKRNRNKLILLPFIVIVPIAALMFTPYAVSYSKSGYNIEPKPIYGTIYCLMYLMIGVVYYFRKSIVDYKKEIMSLFYCGLTITIISVLLNSGFPALSDRFTDIASICLFVCLFFIRPRKQKERLFLTFFIIFVSLMRFRVIFSVIDVPIINSLLYFII